jgi:hypothetical protein
MEHKCRLRIQGSLPVRTRKNTALLYQKSNLEQWLRKKERSAKLSF